MLKIQDVNNIHLSSENKAAEKSAVSRSVIPEASSTSSRDSQKTFQPKLNSHDSQESQVNAHITQEPKTSKRESLESQGNDRVENDFSDTDTKTIVEEPVDVDNTELSGSKLMRALVYNQAGNSRESDSEMDNFYIKPAGTLRGIQSPKKKSPKIPAPSTANTLVSEPRRESVSSVASTKSYQSDSNDRKSIHVKNSDRFLQDYKKFIKKGNGGDSEGSDCDIIPGGAVKLPQAQSIQKTNDQIVNTNRNVPQYNFVSRGVLSQQEVELFNRQRKSLDSIKGDTSNTRGDGDDVDSVCLDKTLSPEKDIKNGKLNSAKNGLSLKSLLKTQEEFTRNGFHKSSSEASLASNDSTTPVSVRMQALLDVIKKNQPK